MNSLFSVLAREKPYISIDILNNMEKLKKNYERSPTLQTVLMVEKFIEEHSGEYTKRELFNSLPKKVMWQTLGVIIKYLESVNKIGIDKVGKIVYIWNPKLVARFRNREDLTWNAK